MTVDYKARMIYESTIEDIMKSEDDWRNILRLTGRLYRYEFDNIVMVYAQCPNATLVADFDTWKKVDRYVKRGSKGIAIFPSRALKPYMRYVFDIGDTGGRNSNLTWSMEGDNLKAYVDYLISKGQIAPYEDASEENLKNILKDFTTDEIRVIIKEEFAKQISELNMITGSGMKVFSEETQGLTATDMVERSVMYAVGTRCGFDMSSVERDFSQIVNYSNEELIYRLGSLVCDVSCDVLRSISRNFKTIEKERRIAYGSIGINLPRSRGNTVPEYSDGGRAGEEAYQSWEVRTSSNELSQGEREAEIQQFDEIRDIGGEDASGGRGSVSVVGDAYESVPSEAQATESKLYDGDVEIARASEDGGRGDSPSANSVQISLEDEELNSELEEINTLGNKGADGSYHQASFFDSGYEVKEKYSYILPKTETVIPHEYVVEALMRGSGYADGKKRIYELYQDILDAGERAKQIKKEYGLGGAGWPLEGYGLHGYDSFSAKGFKLQWRDEEGEKEGYLSWNHVEREIRILILTGEYYQPPVETLDDWEEAAEFAEEVYGSIADGSNTSKATVVNITGGTVNNYGVCGVIASVVTADGTVTVGEVNHTTSGVINNALCPVGKVTETTCKFCDYVAYSIDGEAVEKKEHEYTLVGSIVYENYFAMGFKTTKCECGDEQASENATEEALFTWKGYSRKTFGDSLAVTQGFYINQAALSAYKELKGDIEVGVVATVNKEMQDLTPVIDNETVIGGKFDTAANDYVDVMLTGIPTAHSETYVVFCLYIIDGGETYYLDGGVTAETVKGISHSLVQE